MESTENLLPNRAVSEKAEVCEALIQARVYSIDGRVKVNKKGVGGTRDRPKSEFFSFLRSVCYSTVKLCPLPEGRN
jgi:hypothetical protein